MNCANKLRYSDTIQEHKAGYIHNFTETSSFNINKQQHQKQWRNNSGNFKCL